ncbi:unnamed protein product [Ranitomeya imitator]|uniref:Uncharacterized protein n=1 Tax=Ranitomeya imitator TaxID=111125 RepID=A0ABN9MGT1_9NEOB|nr:unnamed protein product [Ranitomeya imitator]
MTCDLECGRKPENNHANTGRTYKLFADVVLGRLFQRHVQPLQSDVLDRLMNGPIRKLLRIIPDEVRWGGQAALVFENMAGDFMKPVVDVVDELLSAGINVTVYNGQLDLIVDTVGQESWVKQLQWKRREEFRSLHWRPLHLSEAETAAFYKRLENFSFYWILKAGHMNLPRYITHYMQQQNIIQRFYTK